MTSSIRNSGFEPFDLNAPPDCSSSESRVDIHRRNLEAGDADRNVRARFDANAPPPSEWEGGNGQIRNRFDILPTEIWNCILSVLPLKFQIFFKIERSPLAKAALEKKGNWVRLAQVARGEREADRAPVFAFHDLIKKLRSENQPWQDIHAFVELFPEDMKPHVYAALAASAQEEEEKSVLRSKNIDAVEEVFDIAGRINRNDVRLLRDLVDRRPPTQQWLSNLEPHQWLVLMKRLRSNNGLIRNIRQSSVLSEVLRKYGNESDVLYNILYNPNGRHLRREIMKIFKKPRQIIFQSSIILNSLLKTCQNELDFTEVRKLRREFIEDKNTSDKQLCRLLDEQVPEERRYIKNHKNAKQYTLSAIAKTSEDREERREVLCHEYADFRVMDALAQTVKSRVEMLDLLERSKGINSYVIDKLAKNASGEERQVLSKYKFGLSLKPLLLAMAKVATDPHERQAIRQHPEADDHVLSLLFRTAQTSDERLDIYTDDKAG